MKIKKVPRAGVICLHVGQVVQYILVLPYPSLIINYHSSVEDLIELRCTQVRPGKTGWTVIIESLSVPTGSRVNDSAAHEACRVGQDLKRKEKTCATGTGEDNIHSEPSISALLD